MAKFRTGGPAFLLRVKAPFIRFKCWAKTHFLRLHPLVADWGWAGMIITGISVESGAGEYLLGLIILCASAVALALVSLRIDNRFFRIAVLASSVFIIWLSFEWTYEVKGNNPWSHLLRRHDYTATVFLTVETTRNDTAGILLYAKRDGRDHIVTPVPLVFYVRIANLEPTPTRITNLDFLS
jgi:hypothetical protein